MRSCPRRLGSEEERGKAVGQGEGTQRHPAELGTCSQQEAQGDGENSSGLWQPTHLLSSDSLMQPKPLNAKSQGVGVGEQGTLSVSEVMLSIDP